MTYTEQRSLHLPEHVTIDPAQLSGHGLPQISEIGFFNGQIGVRSTPENALRMSIVALCAADVSRQNFKDYAGAATASHGEHMLDSVYDHLGLTSPAAHCIMTARAWQRGHLYPARSITLPTEQEPDLEAVPPAVAAILGALSLEHNLDTIQKLPQFKDVPVRDTLEAFQSEIGVRSSAAALSFGFMTGAVRPGGLKAQDSSKHGRKPELHVAEPKKAPPFSIPDQLNILEPDTRKPKDTAWPKKLAVPDMVGQRVYWGGGEFEVDLPEEQISTRYVRALILSCFDMTDKKLADLMGYNNTGTPRSLIKHARRELGLESGLGITVQQLFDRHWLRVSTPMPLPKGYVSRQSLLALEQLRGARSIQEVADRMTKTAPKKVSKDMADNYLKQGFQGFGVNSARALLTASYGMQMWRPTR